MDFLNLQRKKQQAHSDTPRDPAKLLCGLGICFAATVFMALVIRLFAPGTSGIDDGWGIIRDAGLAVMIFVGACLFFLHKRMTAQPENTKETPNEAPETPHD